MRHSVQKLTLSGLFLALCLLLPFLTGQIPQIGSMLSPMHIPVLLCGFVCGWPWGMAVGFIAPLLRTAIWQMPPLFPKAVAMAFELAAYGAFAGLSYRLLPKKPLFVYVDLILSMLLGRVVWGGVMTLLAALASFEFSFRAFLAGAFVTALPGIICHILLIPPVVLLLRKAGVMRDEEPARAAACPSDQSSGKPAV